MTNCPRCGGDARSIDGAYQWFESFEEALRHIQLTKAEARRIQRKIAETKDLEALPATLEAINPKVGRVVQEAVRTAPSREERRARLQTICTVVMAFATLFAAVNSAGPDTLVGKALAAWDQSDDTSDPEQRPQTKPKHDAMQRPDKNGAKVK